MSDSLWPHGLQHARFPCPSPSPGVFSNSCPLSQWCHPTISSSVVPFSSCLQSFPASASFPISQLFSSGGQIIGASASASVLPVKIQGWHLLGITGWISLQSKGLSRVFSSTTWKVWTYISGKNPTWSWCIIFTNCWIQFVNILLRIFASIYIRGNGVYFLFRYCHWFTW